MKLLQATLAAAFAVSSLGIGGAALAQGMQQGTMHHDAMPGDHPMAGERMGGHHGGMSHHRQHKVCKTVWRHHHRQRVCNWR